METIERPNRKKEQGAETKRKIYDCAKILFTQQDPADVSVDAIVIAAGVSKGTFYVHYESKDALIASLLSDSVTNLDLDYKSFLFSLPPGMSAPDTLLRLIEKICDVLVDTIGYETMGTIYKLHLTRTVDTQSAVSYNRELYRLFSEVLQTGIERCEFATVLPIDILAKHLVMAIRGLTYEWCIRYPDFDLKENARLHFQTILTGLQIRDTKS